MEYWGVEKKDINPGPLGRDSLLSGQSALVANKEINDDRKVPNHIHWDRQHGKAHGT
jgi:hypothetical protein